MTEQEISKLMAWAANSSRILHFAFGIAAGEGVLILDKNHKGRAVLHDLVKSQGPRELKSRAYGTVGVSSTDATVTFTANKAVGTHVQNLVKSILEKTKVKTYRVVFVSAGEGDEEESEV